MGFIRTIFGFIIASILIGFSIFNRQAVSLTYSPIHESLEIPLYLIALAFMAIGFIYGGITAWLNGSKLRKTKRQQRKTIKSLEKELNTIQKKENSSKTPPSDFFPALPLKNTQTPDLPEAENSSIKQR